MAFVFNIHTQALEFAHKPFDLLFNWIAAHVTKIFERLTAKNFVNRSSQSICNGDFGFIA
mgnify:CR=1 FL=1